MVYPTILSIKSHCLNIAVLAKSRVVRLMLLTAAVGMLLTPTYYWHLPNASLSLLGIAFAAYAAGMLNQILEQDSDKQMQRTAKRPLATGSISQSNAASLALSSSLLSLMCLSYAANPLTIVLTTISMLGYSWFYTQILKPNTTQNIVIGGLFGAMPPLLGWSALTNSIGPQPLILVAIIYTWTPPHFWCLALTKIDDYAKTQTPMLPNVYGIACTKTNIMCYSILLVLCTQVPFMIQMSGLPYLIGINCLNLLFLYKMYQVYCQTDPKTYLHGFLFSNAYLALVFVILLVDHLCL